MSHVFDTAVCMAQKMAAPKQHITITMGGLPSVMKDMNINGQPHELSYITPDEGNLLQQLGGSGRMVDGIPAYDIEVYDDQGNPSGTGGTGTATGGVDEGAATGPGQGEVGRGEHSLQEGIDYISEAQFSKGLAKGMGWGLDVGNQPDETWGPLDPESSIYGKWGPRPGPSAKFVGSLLAPGGIVGLLASLLGVDAKAQAQQAASDLGHWATGKVTATGEAPGPGQLGLFDAPPAPPAFDADSPGGKDPTKMLEEKDDEEEKKKKSIMSKYFEDLLEDEEEEDDVEGYNPQTGESTAGVDLSFLEGLPEVLQNILKTSYGKEIMNTGLPSVRKEGRMA